MCPKTRCVETSPNSKISIDARCISEYFTKIYKRLDGWKVNSSDIQLLLPERKHSSSPDKITQGELLNTNFLPTSPHALYHSSIINQVNKVCYSNIWWSFPKLNLSALTILQQNLSIICILIFEDLLFFITGVNTAFMYTYFTLLLTSGTYPQHSVITL